MKVFGIIGWKNAGKTGLMERLVAEITGRGLSVSTVKHVHHDVDLDQPGKDTFRHRQAGAREVVLASRQRFALMAEHRGAEPDLAQVLARLAPVDLVLVEGYKRDAHPKIEVFRAETGQPLIHPGDALVRAVATDAVLPDLPVPLLDLNDAVAIADFILTETGLKLPPVTGRFDTVIIVDWSASNVPTPARESKDAVWIGIARASGDEARYFRTRASAEAALLDLLDQEKTRRVLVGFDFPMGYPQGFAERLTGTASAKAVWGWIETEMSDDAHNRNNRLEVAARANRAFAGPGPFWVVNQGLARTDLPFGKIGKVDFAALGVAEMRQIERSGLAGRPKSVWQLTGPGSVGSQSLTGLPVIARLSRKPGVAVWPFDGVALSEIVVAEVYPSLLTPAIGQSGDPIRDRAQVRLLARALLRLPTDQMARLTEVPDIAREEGWILGAGHAAALMALL